MRAGIGLEHGTRWGVGCCADQLARLESVLEYLTQTNKKSRKPVEVRRTSGGDLAGVSTGGRGKTRDSPGAPRSRGGEDGEVARSCGRGDPPGLLAAKVEDGGADELRGAASPLHRKIPKKLGRGAMTWQRRGGRWEDARSSMYT